jgi:outer membrane protein assembly factor BamA
LERNRQRVFNTTLFVYVKLTPVRTAGRVNILIEVKENWYIWAGPVFKLADRNFNEWWNERDRDLSRTTYGGFLYHANLRGRKEKLRVGVETGFSDRFQVSYEVPYIDKKRQTGINLLVRYRVYRDIAFNASSGRLLYTGIQEIASKRLWEGLLQLRRRRSFYDVHQLELGYTHGRIADTLVQLNAEYYQGGAQRQRYVELAYLFSHDTRDNVNYPWRGLVLTGSVRQRGLLPTDDVRILELRAGGGYYRPLAPRWSLGLVNNFRVSLARQQPFNQLRGLGFGEEFLRGFDLYVINGTAFGLAKSTLRFQLWTGLVLLPFIPAKQFNTLPLAIYPTVFADAGYVRNPYAGREMGSTLANQGLASAGMGLDVVTLLNTTVRLNLSHNSVCENNLFVNLQKEFVLN